MAKKKRYNYIKKKTARGTVPCILTMLLSLGLLLTALILSVYFQGQGHGDGAVFPLLSAACAS